MIGEQVPKRQRQPVDLRCVTVRSVGEQRGAPSPQRAKGRLQSPASGSQVEQGRGHRRYGRVADDHTGLLQIEDCLDSDGRIALPPGTTLPSLVDRNIANVGDAVAYRYLCYTGAADGQAINITWSQLGSIWASVRKFCRR